MTIREYYNTYFTQYPKNTFYLWQDADIRAICRRNGLRIIDFSRSSSVLGTGEAWLGCVVQREVAQ